MGTIRNNNNEKMMTTSSPHHKVNNLLKNVKTIDMTTRNSASGTVTTMLDKLNNKCELHQKPVKLSEFHGKQTSTASSSHQPTTGCNEDKWYNMALRWRTHPAERKSRKNTRHSWHIINDARAIDVNINHACTTSEDSRLPELFSANLTHQMKAVSSPSLSENPLDSIKPAKPHNSHIVNGVAGEIPPNVPGSVLQKLKNTLSHLKGKSANHNVSSSVNSSASDSTTYRFGPLVWRSSKERRKAKHQRRDKCNSGDSGIQVELDNEDVIQPQHHVAAESIETSPKSYNMNVRRANSAKLQSTSSTSVKAKALRKNEGPERINATPLPARSLSQPNGLDRIPKDPDNSDTDSDDFHNDDRVHQQIFAEVLYSFQAVGSQELALEKGALIEVIKRDVGPWWWGRVKHDALISSNLEPQEGWFPKEFVRIIPSFPRPQKFGLVEAKNCDINFPIKFDSPTLFKQSSEYPTKKSSPSTSLQNSEAIRENVVKELLETEINYVNLLGSLCVGFLKELRQRSDIFPTESLILIFSNIEKVWRFQETFLDGLRQGIEQNRIAETFLEFQTAFMVYSTYCNSYSRALMELESYTGNIEAAAILESCRVKQNLPELPLSAHLLAPIQRICRYPLHLSELLKYTPIRQHILSQQPPNQQIQSDIEAIDCKETFEMALGAMKRVTEMVNEGKRHSEYLSRIQARFDNFQGPSINLHSSRLFLQTDAIRMTPNLWNNTYTLFLFDRQLIYCKKDLLKRNSFIYKGRIFLDNCRILNLPDGKIFGVTLKNALRLYCDTRNKWFDFCFRSSSSKLRFLNTLSAERQFCGQNLFVSELAGVDDENLSDRDYSSDRNDYNSESNDHQMTTDDGVTTTIRLLERGIDVENVNTMNMATGCSDVKINAVPLNNGKVTATESHGKYKKSDTLPKKSRKLHKEPIITSYEYHTNSLGRKRLGNWFRKAKSTNSTPSQSPTHHPLAISVAAQPSNSTSSTTVLDSSPQNSPALYLRPPIANNSNNNGKPTVKHKEANTIAATS